MISCSDCDSCGCLQLKLFGMKCFPLVLQIYIDKHHVHVVTFALMHKLRCVPVLTIFTKAMVHIISMNGSVAMIRTVNVFVPPLLFDWSVLIDHVSWDLCVWYMFVSLVNIVTRYD